MQPFFRFIENNTSAIFLCVIVWNVIGLAFLLWRRSRKSQNFPPLSNVTIVFRERFASGTSHSSWFTRFGGASNCLSVVVTDSELWITTFFPFKAIAGIYDLEHRVLTQSLTNVSRNGNLVSIDFGTQNGSHRRIVLRLRRAVEFVSALPQHVVTSNG